MDDNYYIIRLVYLVGAGNPIFKICLIIVLFARTKKILKSITSFGILVGPSNIPLGQVETISSTGQVNGLALHVDESLATIFFLKVVFFTLR